jgi:Leucine-rich repeat (LRR) protein
MQVAPVETTAPSTRQQTTIAPHQQGTVVHPLPNSMVLSWLPLHGYQNKLAIALPCLPLQILRTVQLPEPLIGLSQWVRASPNLPAVQIINTDPFPAELIEMIQRRCSHRDLLALTASNKAAFATRFANPRLQHLHFTSAEQVAQFLDNCWETTHTASSTGAIRTREEYQGVKALTLTLKSPVTFKQSERLFFCLSGITQLHIRLDPSQGFASLTNLLKAAGPYVDLIELTVKRFDNSDKPVTDDVLPDDLWELTMLETLVLQGFAGSQPISECIGELTQLTSLHIEDMPRLTALPKSLFQLSKLENLVLANLRALPTIPDEIGQLTALKALRLTRIDFYSLPENFCQLTQLEELTLSDLFNFLRIPANIGQLTALKALKLHKLNQVKTLPASIEKLVKLEKLELISLLHGPLQGVTQLPDQISKLTALKSLHIEGIQSLKTLPLSFRGLAANLEQLTLIGRVTSSMEETPEVINHFTALRSLTLWEMRDLKKISIQFAQLTQLEELRLGYVGTNIDALTDEIGQLKTLKVLHLRGLWIKTLPKSIGQLQKLEKLSLIVLSWDRLPEEISQLSALRSLHVEGMHSLKALPASLGQLPSLEDLYLASLDNITELPDEIGQLSGLKSLHIRVKLKELPASLGKLTQLEKLTLHNLCYYIDELPDEIGQLSALRSLHIEDLGLKALPTSLERLHKLEELSLSYLPRITELPDGIGQLTKLKTLKLDKLWNLKALPASLGRIPNLQKIVIKNSSNPKLVIPETCAPFIKTE